MGSTEKFCLRWNDFESNISGAFRELREDKDFFDVTLACDDDQIQAHKVILSACSPFFRQILKRNKHDHPLLYMKGVRYIDLVSVLNFMYHGEVNIAQEELNSFLATAEDLQVKGLTQNNSDKQHKVEIPKPKLPARPVPEIIEPAVATSRHPTTNTYCQVQEVQEVQEVEEVIPVKSEPINHHQPDTENVVKQYSVVSDTNVVTNTSVEMYQDNYNVNEYEAFEEGTDEPYDSSMMHLGDVDANKEHRKQLIWSLIAKLGGGSYQCTQCGLTKGKSGITALKNHVESNHLPGLEYPCEICGKVLKNSNQYHQHLTKHRHQEGIEVYQM